MISPAPSRPAVEVAILPIADSNDGTARLAVLIEGVAGEFSPFEELHGLHIDGVDMKTAVLPGGWRYRLMKVQNANAAAPTAEPRSTGWCLDMEDLCVAKLCALREEDQNFEAALLDARLVSADDTRSRLDVLPAEHQAAAARAQSWLAGH